MIVSITARTESAIELSWAVSTDARIASDICQKSAISKNESQDQLRYFAALKKRFAGEPTIDFWLERMKLAEWKTKKTTGYQRECLKFHSSRPFLHSRFADSRRNRFLGLDPVKTSNFLIEVVAELKAQHKTIIFSTRWKPPKDSVTVILINKSAQSRRRNRCEVKEVSAKNNRAPLLGGSAILEKIKSQCQNHHARRRDQSN